MATNNAINLKDQGTVYYNGTGTFTGIDGSTATRVLTSNGTGVAPSFQALSTGSTLNGFLSTGTAGSGLADSTTYYLMNNQLLSAASGVAGTIPSARYYVTSATTLTSVVGVYKINGTLGTSENMTLFVRVNDTTNTNVTTTLKGDSAINTISNTSLSISLNAGDYFVFGLTTPAFVTNPGNSNFAFSFND